jgi:hypothetical protein
MNELITIHPYRARGLWVFDDPAVGLRNHSFPAPMRLSIGWFKISLTLSWVSPWSSRHDRFPDFKLSSSGAVKSSAAIGTTALRSIWRAGSAPLC